MKYSSIEELVKAYHILNAVQEACLEIDSSGIILFVNKRTEKLFRTEKNRLIGKYLWEVFAESSKTSGVIAIRKTLNEKIPADVSYFSEFFQTTISLRSFVSEHGTVLLIKTESAPGADIIRVKEDLAQKAADKYKSLFTSIEEGFCIFEVLYGEAGNAIDYRFVEANPAFLRQTGLSNVIGKTARELFFFTGPYGVQTYDSIIKSGKSVQLEIHNEETRRWYYMRGSRVGSADSHLIALIYNDITERKETEEQQAFLLKLGDILRSASDATEIEKGTCQLLGKFFRAERVYYVEANEKEGYAEIGWEYLRGGSASIKGRYPLASYPSSLKPLRHNEPVIIPDIYNRNLSPEEATAMKKLHIRSLIAVPLVRKRGLAGALTVGDDKPREWKSNDVDLVRKTLEQTWSALERARVEEALRKSEERKAFLLKLSDALRPLSNPLEVQRTATRILGQQLHTDRSFYCEFNFQRDEYIIADNYVRKGVPKRIGRFPTNAFSEVIQGLSRGETAAIADTQHSPALNSREKKACMDANILAAIGVPLIKEGRLVAQLTVQQTQPRKWTSEEISFVQETAERTWSAVERGRAENAIQINNQRISALKEAYQSVVNKAKLKDSLQLLSQLVAKETFGEARTAFYNIDMDGSSLHLILEAGTMPAMYQDEIDKISTEKDLFTWGRAIPAGQPVITADVFEDPLWKPWTFLARKYNYRGCWSFPIKTRDNKAVGIFSMYFGTKCDACEQYLSLADIVTRTAAVIIANHTDNLNRTKAEDALMQSEQRLKQLLQQRDEFIVVASHELKTPVTSMKAYAEIVQRRLEKLGYKEDSELLKRLNVQINRLTILINDLMDITKISEGQLKLTLEPLDVNGLLKERIDEISLTTSHPLELHAGKLPLVNADRERIGQVITNLLSNAIKYSPEGTPIIVTTHDRENEIQVSVRDQGYGISEADQKKIFDRFFRVSVNNMDRFSGMGIGLYITSEILRRHQGTITVKSKPGEGSVFTFTVPHREIQANRSGDA